MGIKKKIRGNFVCGKWTLGVTKYVDFILLHNLNYIQFACLKSGVIGGPLIGSDVPWLDCPASNAITWVITVTE